MLSLFSNEKINKGRQVEFDIAKALSIIFMVIVHVEIVSTYFQGGVTEGYLFILGNILCGPSAAPVFMFCMGIGMVYSRHSKSNIMIKRGLKLLILGLIVNIGEFIIPYFFSGFLLNRWDLIEIFGGLIIFYVDVLAFAGLSFILTGILKNFLSDKQIIIIAILLSLFGSFIRIIDFNNIPLNFLFGYLIGTSDSFTAFPLFNWFIFPIAGLVYGNYFIRAKGKADFFKYWIIFLIIPVIYFIYESVVPEGFLINDIHFYFMTTLDALFCLLYMHGVLGFCWKISKVLPDKLTQIATFLSKHITDIYIAQWFLIPIIMITLYYYSIDLIFEELSLYIVLPIIILVLSSVLAILKSKITS